MPPCATRTTKAAAASWAWKGGLDWRVANDVRLRLTRSRDVRAGSCPERFDTSRGPGNITDPFTGVNVPYPISVVAGGNPEVDPEQADTLTYGLVYQPSWLSGFALSVDWFDIDMQDAIGQLGAQEIVDQCFAGAAAICDLITRDSGGSVILIENVFINTDAARTRGLDIEASYDHGISVFGGDERMTLRLLGTYLKEVSTTLAGAATVDRAGQTGPAVPGGGAGGAPEWQASLNLGYKRNGFSASVQERYISDGVYNATWIEGVDIDDNSVESALYTNLNLSYETDFGWRRYALRGLAGGEQPVRRGAGVRAELRFHGLDPHQQQPVRHLRPPLQRRNPIQLLNRKRARSPHPLPHRVGTASAPRKHRSASFEACPTSRRFAMNVIAAAAVATLGLMVVSTPSRAQETESRTTHVRFADLNLARRTETSPSMAA